MPVAVTDLKKLLSGVEADLRTRSDEPGLPWADALRSQYGEAIARGRTALTWSAWRDDEVAQAGVAWVLASVFLRFCEDNDLLAGQWIAGPGTKLALAIDAEHAYYAADPTRDARGWLREGFAALAATKPGSGILDRAHNPVWTAPLGVAACKQILDFWREQDSDGSLRRSLADESWDTRFLGDIYQDLSESAKKKYALLQTPEFVESFILDRTLTPALAAFGLDGLRLIDCSAGSAHFLLGAFDRLLEAWRAEAPGLDRRELVQRALDHIHGVDINPFAVAIARFRLAVAALRESGLTRLADAPAFRYHLAVGDSLLAGIGHQGTLLDETGGLADHAYPAEDVREHPGILEPGRYHVVVGNPPYITVKDKALNEAYRAAYPSCRGKYALSVPFMEQFFRLAVKGGAGPGGFVGQITSNSFMKREFGAHVIETLLAGRDPGNPVDLLEVIDTSGAFIPGHGTPTVILIGRRRRPVAPIVRAVLGVRGEPGQPADPARGAVWSEIVEHVDDPGYDGTYVTVTDLDRAALSTHPWSLTGGGADLVFSRMEEHVERLREALDGKIGFASFPGADDVFFAPERSLARSGVPAHLARQVITGEVVRDWAVQHGDWALVPYDSHAKAVPLDADGWGRRQWPMKAITSSVKDFEGVSRSAQGEHWWLWYRWVPDRYRTPLSIAFAFVATHNHFVLDRGGKVFNRSAPVIKLPAGASEEDHLELLAVLNSSAACFWLKQVSHDKGIRGEGGGFTPSDWERFYEFTGTKLQEFPLPPELPLEFGIALDGSAQDLVGSSPAAVCSRGAIPSREALDVARTDYDRLRAQMIALQEELDWFVYHSYGLLEGLLVMPHEDDVPGLALGERAFEIALARRVVAGAESTAWFERHGSTPITALPSHWSAEYRALVQRRLDVIASNPAIRLLERPEFKRRWSSESWEAMETAALRDWLLDRLEDPGLWSDVEGPRVVSGNGLATRLKSDRDFAHVLGLWAGNPDVDVAAGLAALLKDEGVPCLAAFRYTDSGLRKRAEWEAVWALQRREDAGEKVDIPVPPRYQPKDFARTSYWHARGKLDVPKERFIAYPGAGRDGDRSTVLGWAGWDHAQQAQALARLLVERRSQDGWPADRVLPMLAGLAELEPWLHRWHADLDPTYGMSPADAITGLVDGQCAELGLTREDLAAWRAAAPARGRSVRA